MLTTTYSVTELKARLSAVLALVSKGREALVTDHNKIVARIVSVSPVPALPRGNLEAFFKEKPIKLAKGARDSTSLIRALRDEERH